MPAQYFQNCTSLSALRKELRRLAKLHHPDVGGSLATMQDINAQYAQAEKRLQSPSPSRAYTPPQPAPKPEPQGSTGRQYSAREDIWESYFTNWQARMHEEILRNTRRAWESYVPDPEPPRQEYQPFRDQVDQHKLKLKEELAWALNEIRLAQKQGLLRNCTAYTDRMQTTLKVGGNTYPYREWFKAHGFHWKPEVRQWHFHKKPLFTQEESEDEEEDDELDPYPDPDDIPW
jgi:hypothetical protein